MRALATAWLLFAVPAPAAPGRGTRMSIEEKAGQLFMIAIDTAIAHEREADIKSGRLGGVLLRWDRFTGPEARAFNERLQSWAAESPARLPVLVAADHEGGPVFTQWRYGGTVFPGNMALGAARQPGLAEAAARATARELRSLGIHVDFAPVLDVNNNPDNPIIGVRSFGQDPGWVSRLGLAALRGYRAGGVLPVVKHFPGHGDTDKDSHTALPENSKTIEQLEAAELVPFRAAIKAEAPALMPAHMVFPALGSADQPVSLSKEAMTVFLRGRLGFNGLVFSDSLDMGGVAGVGASSSAAIAAFLAGNDVLLLGKGDYPSAFEAFVAAVRDGRIPEFRLDESVARVLAAKRRLGLLGPRRRPAPPPETLAAAAHRALARRIAESAVTLLRDPARSVPLRLAPEQTLALVLVRPARFAAPVAAFAEQVRRRHSRVELVEVAELNPSTTTVATALARVSGAAAVVFGSYGWSGVDVAGQRALLERLAALEIPLIVLSQMNPYDLRDAPARAASLCLYGITPPSLEAAARVLFGELRPKGRLPVDIPGYAKVGDGLRGAKRIPE